MKYCLPSQKQLDQFRTYVKDIIRNNGSLTKQEAVQQLKALVVAKTGNEDLASLYSSTLESNWDNFKQQVEGTLTADLRESGLLTSRAASDTQNKEAKEWFESSPLSSFISYSTLNDVINSNAFATWTKHGIILFKGAEYSDLYHEAWHGFSQIYLDTKEKQALYGEVRKLHPDLSNLEAEEMLAEDFKQYVLSGSKSVLNGKPYRNLFFRRIYNFLRSLVGSKSYAELMNEDMAATSLKDVYERLYTGNFNDYSPSVTNVEFTRLNSGIKAQDDSQELSYAESSMVANVLDSILTTTLLQNNVPFEKLNEPAFQNEIYTAAKNLLTDAIGDQLETWDDADLAKSDRILNFITSNWADTRRFHQKHSQLFIVNNVETFEVDEDGNIQVSEDLGKDDTLTSDMQRDAAFERSGTDNPLNGLDSKIKSILSTLTKVDKNGNDINTVIGFPENESFNHVWNSLINMLTDTGANYDQMYQNLDKFKGDYPFINELQERLGYPVTDLSSSYNIARHQIQTQFMQSFNKYRAPLTKLSIESEGDGIRFQFLEIDSRKQVITEDWSSAFKAQDSNKSPYIIRNAQGENMVDLAAHFKDLIAGKTGWNPQEFYEMLGFKFTNPAESMKLISEEHQDRQGYSHDARIQAFIQDVRAYNSNNPTSPIELTDPVKQLRSGVGVGNDKIQGVADSVDFLIEIEKKFNKAIPSFMQENAEGKRESEVMLPNEVNIITSALNNVERYPNLQALYTDEENPDIIQRFNPLYNINIKHSLTMAKLFDMDENSPTYGNRIINIQTGEPVKIEVFNYNGVQYNDGNGKTAAKTTGVEGITKTYMDFNNFITKGVMENIRAESKSMAVAIRVANGRETTVKDKYDDTRIPGQKGLQLFTGRYWYGSASDMTSSDPKTGKLQVDIREPYSVTEDNKELINSGKVLKTILGYAQDEIERIIRFKQGLDNDVSRFKKNGGKFTIFQDVFSFEGLDEKLYKAMETESDAEKIVAAHRADIRKALNNYFRNSSNELYEYIGDYRKEFTNADVLNRLLGNDAHTDYDRAFRRALVFFNINQWIHTVEQSKILFGDFAGFKDGDDVTKRDATYISTGQTLRDDITHRQAMNNLQDEHSIQRMKELGVEDWSRPLDNGTMRVGVSSDIEVGMKPEDLEEYKEAFKAIKNSDGSRKYSDSAIDKILKPFSAGKMTEGDGQGWITLDGYRRFKLSQGVWTQELENLYQHEVTGKEFKEGEMAEFFPPIKAQYAGTLLKMQENGVNHHAVHKYSLSPMIPSVIKGTNLERIQDRMIFNNLDYIVNASGSKMADYDHFDFYSVGRNPHDFKTSITPNIVFRKYMKEQVKMHEHFDNRVNFSTQLRTLLTNRLMQDGAWVNKEAQQKGERFLNLVNKYSDTLKNQLLREFGITEENGTYKVKDHAPLIRQLHKELKTRNMPEHVINFVDIDENGKLTKPLDTSLYVQAIENMLMAIVNNRLVTQKNFGEALVQTANTGYEKYRNPTEQEQELYANDLPFYKPNGRKVDGKKVTSAMKVKVALTDNFAKLLKLSDNEGNKIGTLQRLNELLQDEKWLDTDDHRKMITLSAVRIPVQGHNSMEFMEVHEFLPKQAGLMIILPTGIVAKSGGDFDIDKLTVLNPEYYMDGGKPTLLNDKSDIEGYLSRFKDMKVNQNASNIIRYKESFIDALRTIYGNMKESRSMTKFIEENQDNLDKLLSLVDNDEDFDELVNQITNTILKVQENKGNIDGLDIIEEMSANRRDKLLKQAYHNSLLDSIVDILQMPSNFEHLITPNSTDLVQPLIKELDTQKNFDYNPNRSVANPEKYYKSPSFTRSLEVRHNAFKHDANLLGKDALAIGALANTLKSRFNQVGAYLNNLDTPILLDHNKLSVNGKEYPSLSSLLDANNKEDLSELISQMMNGWVDIGKDAWIFDLNMDKVGAPVALLLTSLGVPIRETVKFMTDPFVIKYFSALRIASSPMAKLITDNPNSKAFKSDIISRIFKNSGLSSNYIPDVEKAINNGGFNLNDEKAFKSPTHQSAYKLIYVTRLMKLADDLRTVQGAINFDTSKSPEAFSSLRKINSINEAKATNFLSSHIIDSLINDTTIKSFKEANKLGIYVSGELLPGRNNVVYNTHISDLVDAAKQGKKDATKLMRTYKSDLLLGLLQSEGIKDIKGLGGINDKGAPLWTRLVNANATDNLAKRLQGIVHDYPELTDKYLLPSVFIGSLSRKNPNLLNVRAKEGYINSTNINDLYEEMKQLSSRDVAKVEDPIANGRITTVFRDIAVLGLLQSGIIKSPISYMEIIPQELYENLIKPHLDTYLDIVTDREKLKEFDKQFKLKNGKYFGITEKYEPYRFKSYSQGFYDVINAGVKEKPEDSEGSLGPAGCD